jgi:hypothetical protein
LSQLVSVRAVESKLKNAKQHLLPVTRRRFVRTEIPLDALNQKQQTNHTSRHSLRVRDPVTLHSFSWIVGFANVKHAFRAPAEVVNAGLVGIC